MDVRRVPNAWRNALAGKDEISSTEKLLTLIRSGDADGGNPEAPDPADPRTAPGDGQATQAVVAKKRFGMRGTPTLGIDFGRTTMKMALVRHTADKMVLERFATVAYEKDVFPESPRFPVFLKSVLNDFCVKCRELNIWSSIPSTNVGTRFLRIPKVPRKQLANTVYWSYKKEAHFEDRDSILDFFVLGDSVEDGIPKTDVIAYTAPRLEIENRRRVFSKAGYPLKGVSIVSFALQNLFQTGWTETLGENVCTLFIGSDWSRIAIFSGNSLILSRDIKAGLEGMVAAIATRLEQRHPDLLLAMGETDGGPALPRETDDRPLPFARIAQATLEGYIEGRDAFELEETDARIDADEVFEMIAPSLDRIVQQVERTLDHYYLNFENQHIGKVYISGSICSRERLVTYIGTQLGMAVDFIDPFYTSLPGGLGVPAPESPQERGGFVAAVGMALSDNKRTPNFLYTNKEKEKAEKINRFNRSIFGVAIVLMLVCIGYFTVQSSRLDKARIQNLALQHELERFIPRVDQNMILELATHAFSERQSVDAFARKYEGMAVIHEIIEITPPGIRLAGLSVELGGIEKKAGDTENRTLQLDGVLYGDRLNFESALAGYMVRLEGSPLFRQPEILKQSLEVVEGREVLFFTARAKLI